MTSPHTTTLSPPVVPTRTRMKRIGWPVWAGIGVVLIVLLLVGANQGWFGKSGGIEVETATVARRTIVAKVSESGTIQPDVEVSVTSDVSGEIISLHVKEGEYVRRGQLLFTVRPENFQAALEQASASLNTAKADYQNQQAAIASAQVLLRQDSITFVRQKQLYEQKVISEQAYDQARFAYEGRRAQIEQNRQLAAAAYYRIRSADATRKQASENLARTSVYASMDGTVTRMSAELGTRLVGTQQMSGTEAMRIADLTNMEVQVEINENDIVRLSIGDSASIEVDAYPDKKFLGRVTEIGYSSATALTGSGQGSAASSNAQDQITNYPVKIAVLPESYVKDKALMAGRKKTDSPFRPGMSAMVSIYVDRADSVLAVPIQSVTIDKKAAEGGAPTAKPQEVVYTLKTEGDQQKAVATAVTTGISDDEFIEVKTGLELNQKFITGPYTTVNKLLSDGTGVKEKPAEPKDKDGKGKDGNAKKDSTAKTASK